MKMNILQKSTIKLDEKWEVQFLYEGRTTIPEKSPNLYYVLRYILSNLKLIGKLKQKLLHGNHCLPMDENVNTSGDNLLCYSMVEWKMSTIKCWF
jgi:hypothetical protein